MRITASYEMPLCLRSPSVPQTDYGRIKLWKTGLVGRSSVFIPS